MGFVRIVVSLVCLGFGGWNLAFGLGGCGLLLGVLVYVLVSSDFVSALVLGGWLVIGLCCWVLDAEVWCFLVPVCIGSGVLVCFARFL